MSDSLILSTQRYTITLERREDGTSTMHRTNECFDALELLAVLTLAQSEVMAQIRGEMPLPTVITREVVKPAKET